MTGLGDLVGRARGMVFDKDGTLIDLDARWAPLFVSLIDSVASQWANPLGDHRAIAEIADRLSMVLGVTGDRLVPHGPAAVQAWEQIRDRIVAELSDDGGDAAHARVVADLAADQAAFGPLTPLGDIAGALLRLAGGGLRLGIATSDTRANTIAELAELGVTDCIEILACGDDGAVKPDPEVLLRICRAWRLDPPDVIFVGDSRQDLETARAAGTAFVAIHDPRNGTSSLAHYADAVVDTIDDLAACVRRAG